jgi:hypothetical protein
MSLAPLTGSAAAQVIINPPLPVEPQPIIMPVVYPCSEIASFSPASARPGEPVDIHLTPPSGKTFYACSVTAVQFASMGPVPFTTVAPHHFRVTVPVGATAGALRVSCRSPITNATWSINSATAFTPINFTNTLNPSSLNLVIGNSSNVTVTLSHPAPVSIPLTLAPSSNAVSVNGGAPGASGSVMIPMNSQSATFGVAAHAAGSASVAVSGPTVTASTLPVTVPTPSFRLSQPADEDVHWGDSQSYPVEVTSENGFAGTVTLTASSLPFGASAAPVSVSVPAGGSATATFTVATAQSATDLGSDSFTLRGQSPGVSDRTRSVDLRVLPDTGTFGTLTWRTASSTCGSLDATVTGTNVAFDGPGFSRQSHPHYQYAWTPDCRGAVVMGPAAAMNAGWPVTIFNFGFDNAIADAPGSRHNLGTAAWNHGQFKVSSDGSMLIAVAQGMNFNANLFDMLNLAQRPPMHSYSLTQALTAEIVTDEAEDHEIKARSSNTNHWTWTLP